MTLRELIDYLENVPLDQVASIGFHNPHSYRGMYDCLAFEPTENVTAKSMLTSAIEALDTSYTGWKGGEFMMGQYTDVYLAEEGNQGEGIGPILLDLMFKE